MELKHGTVEWSETCRCEKLLEKSNCYKHLLFVLDCKLYINTAEHYGINLKTVLKWKKNLC